MDVSNALNRRLLELSAAQGHKGLKMSFAIVMAHAGFPDARARIISLTARGRALIADSLRSMDTAGKTLFHQ